MGEYMDRVDCNSNQSDEMIHQLADEMDRPPKVWIVSEAEGKPSSLGYLREKTFMEGQPSTNSPHNKKEVSYVLLYRN